jgi:hypothetical protein
VLDLLQVVKKEVEMEIKTRTPKDTLVTITVSGTGSHDCKATVTCKDFRGRLEIHSRGLTYPLSAPQNGATHYLKSGKTGIGLTTHEAERVDREYNDWLSNLPQEIKTRLHECRMLLVDAINGTLDEIRYQRDRWFESECKRSNLPQYDHPDVIAAQKALNDFDLEHPEIKAEIEARKAADIERHMWD